MNFDLCNAIEEMSPLSLFLSKGSSGKTATGFSGLVFFLPQYLVDLLNETRNGFVLILQQNNIQNWILFYAAESKGSAQ